MIREPNTEPIPAPEPATPTVAAPAPINLAAESMSLLAGEVCMDLTAATEGWANLWRTDLPHGVSESRAIADMASVWSEIL